MSDKLFDLKPNSDGRTYDLCNVPIFQTHSDRGFDCNEPWLDEAIENHNLRKAGGYTPSVFVGHTVKGGQEKESIGFLDSMYRKGKIVYANITKIPKQIYEKFKANAYPSRSCEVLPKSKRIVGLAFLGATPPHFALPTMSYDLSDEESKWIDYSLQEERSMGKIGEMDSADFAAVISNAVVNGFEQYSQKVENEEKAEYEAFVNGLSPTEQQAFALDPELFIQLYGQYGPGVIDTDVIEQTSGGPINEAAFGEGSGVDPSQRAPIGDLSDTQLVPVHESGALRKAGSQDMPPNTAVADMTQMANDQETLAYALSDLNNKVSVLQNANATLQYQKREAEIKSYLVELRAQGYALGDDKEIERRVNLMMKMPDDVLEEYNQDLRSTLNKVPMSGRYDYTKGVSKNQIEANGELTANYEANKELYRAAGVSDPKYLKLGEYTRTNLGI